MIKIKIKNNSGDDRIFWMGTSIGLFLILLTIALYLNAWRFKSIIDANKSSEDIKSLEYMISLNYDNVRGESNSLKSFTYEDNTFTFKNFPSNYSSNGVCYGYALFEKLAYMNKLSGRKIKINSNEIELKNVGEIGNIFLSADEVKNVYGASRESSAIPNYSNLNKVLNMDPEYIYSMAAGGTIMEDFSLKVNQDKAVIFNAINYFQLTQRKEQGITITSHRYNNKDAANIQAVNEFLTKISSGRLCNYTHEFKTEYITGKIDQDEPVVISISNSNGHAVIGYKYEFIDNETFKVYVADSNIPIIRGENPLKDQVNLDIKNNVYILFKKINGKWHFIYNPKINNGFPYRGIYNSLTPNTSLIIY